MSLLDASKWGAILRYIPVVAFGAMGAMSAMGDAAANSVLLLPAGNGPLRQVVSLMGQSVAVGARRQSKAATPLTLRDSSGLLRNLRIETPDGVARLATRGRRVEIAVSDNASNDVMIVADVDRDAYFRAATYDRQRRKYSLPTRLSWDDPVTGEPQSMAGSIEAAPEVRGISCALSQRNWTIPPLDLRNDFTVLDASHSVATQGLRVKTTLVCDFAPGTPTDGSLSNFRVSAGAGAPTLPGRASAFALNRTGVGIELRDAGGQLLIDPVSSGRSLPLTPSYRSDGADFGFDFYAHVVVARGTPTGSFAGTLTLTLEHD